MRQTSEMAFSAEWLTLREPADHAARDPDLLDQAAGCAGSSGCVLDLGSGTGSTARAFAARGFDSLRWRFLDNDPELLGVARQRHPEAELSRGDLTDIAALPLSGVALVTASALLDLMPRDWIRALATRLAQLEIPFYASLNYDGQMDWTPAHEDDDAVRTHFNAHQRGDKGIGPAVGPDSGIEAARLFSAQGFDVRNGQSPWRIGPDQAPLHDALLDGIGQAAGEAGHGGAAEWTAARRAEVAQSHCVIGHSDLLALPLMPGRGS